MRSLSLSALLISLLCSSALAAPPNPDLEGRRKVLNDLLAEQWEYTLRTSPIYASFLGDKRWNDKLDDFSQKAIDDDLEQSRKFLVRFQAIDTTGFPEQEALNKALMVRDLQMALDDARFKPWEMPVSQLAGIHIDLPQLVSVLSFQNVKDYVHSRQEILDLYRKYIDQMYLKLPTMFGRLPKAKLEVLPIEEFREKQASTEYVQGAQDGSRPAHVMVNTSDFEKGTTLDFETTAYHEGVPGHHLQIAIAQELPQLPPFRQNENYTAFIEGWALYSERLGKEVGFYQDPYSYYGHLQDDMLRAIRLVVDTGFHYKHWTRQQVIDFFHAHSAIDEAEVQRETDRYMANPGQALAYKIGQLEILKLRQYAKDQLGDRFNLSNFHDEVLSAGALPLDVLSTRIHEWVAAQKQ
jgi:uncharacterized protein (DUF885 family)